MPLAIYHIAHIIGLIFVFIGFGAQLSSDSARSAMKWHGTGLVISLISGFGLLAKLQIFAAMPTWVWIKIALWLVLGFLPVLARRRVLAPHAVILLAVIVAGFMGYLGYMKPVF
ncbi:MAG: hypothetical protein ABL974_06535 [Prosthecobacter sp.]